MFLDGGKIWKNVIVVAKQVPLYGYDDDGDGEEVGDDYSSHNMRMIKII